MMELHENIDEALLLLYFSGTLGEKEKEEVENWISLSEENRKIAKQICYIHHVTDIIDTVKQIDPKQALVKLDKRLSKRKKINWWEWGIRAAAVLFIPLFLSFFYFVFNQDKNYDRYVEIRSNPGMMTKVELPDGTWVWLNSASYLKYPVSFEGEYRKVELLGEAYFSVQKDNGRKFLVDVGKGIELEVLGTEFNVDAYPDDKFVVATLVTGRVKFHCQQKGREVTYSMQPGQKVIYNLLDEKLLCTTTFVESDIAWKSGRIIYRDTPLEDALRTLSKRFDVEFRIVNPLLKKYCFTGTFINQRLDKILEHFKIASGVRYRYFEWALENGVGKGKKKIKICKKKKNSENTPSLNKKYGKNIALFFPYKKSFSLTCLPTSVVNFIFNLNHNKFMQKHCSIQILGIKRLLKATLKGIPLPMRLLIPNYIP